jgi:arginase
VLVATRGAKSILEIGAASGYSGIWLGLGARESGGHVVAIEYDPGRAKEAAANVKRAGLDDVVRVVHGDAFAEIRKLQGTFDFVFLDAWKPDYKKFFDMVFPRLTPGAVFTAHNVVNKKSEMEPFLKTIESHPVALHRPWCRHPARECPCRTNSSRARVPPVKPVHIIGVPLDLGGARRGVDMGPSAVRIAGIGEAIAKLGRQVIDKGNLPAPIAETEDALDRHKKYIDPIAAVCRSLHASCLASLEADAIPLVLGGDHSLAAGSVAASADWIRRINGKPLGLIWVDAHGDMNTPETTTSGNVHGMPLAALLGREPLELASIGTVPSVLPQHTVLVGIRNLDENEKGQIRAAGVHVFTMKDIDRQGIATVAERAIELASAGTGGIHVSFDLDVSDPSIAPGVGTPVRGGLDYRESHMIMELVADSNQLIALDLVEVNPTLDNRNATAEFAAELALSALGKRIL